MRMIDADALHAEISAWPESIMYKDWVQSAIANAPTLTQPNEPLTCDGCIALGTSYGPCMNCIRSRLRGDLYRRPPEGEEETP